LRWLGHLCRWHELGPCSKLTLIKPEGPRRSGKRKLKWLLSVEEDLKKMGSWRLCHRIENSGGQFWKTLKFHEDCKVIKVGRLRWLGHLCRMHELGPCSKLSLIKPEGPRRSGKRKLKWLASVVEDLKKMGVRN